MLKIELFDYARQGNKAKGVTVNDSDFYFSYQTVIAFRAFGRLVVSENCWSNTTGKHLNSIDADKSKRVKREVFERLLTETLERLNVTLKPSCEFCQKLNE